MTAGEHGRRVLVAISVAQIATVLDYYALTIALPTIADDFDVAPTDLHWVVTVYLLAFASLLVVGGRLADTLGRRRVLTVGVAGFGLASLAAGLSPTLEVLLVFRGLQGACAALLVPASFAALSGAFADGRRSWAVGTVAGVTSIGTAVGPFVGGVVTGTVGWRWVFFINIPVCLAGVLLCRWAVPETRDRSAPHGLDLPGCGLLMVAVVLLVLGIDRAAAWPVPGVVATMLASFALLGLFLWREHRTATPLIDLSLLTRRGFRAILAAGCLDNHGWALGTFVVTLYLQQVLGISPLEAGAVFLALSAGAAIGGPLAGRLMEHADAARVMAAGLVASVAGMLWVSLGGSLGSVVGALFVLGIGVGLAYSVTNIATLATARQGRAGASMGVTQTAMILTAAITYTTGGIVMEALSGGPHPDEQAIATAMRIGALVVAVGLVVLLPSLRQREPVPLPEVARARR